MGENELSDECFTSRIFFSNGVFLVEGPSEVLFYHELANQLGIDLDFLNLTILSVDGISFSVYVNILNALEIPWVMRTDNDVSKLPNKDLWQYSGINRCLSLAGYESFTHSNKLISSFELLSNGSWKAVSDIVNCKGIFLSKIDLENDLVSELPGPILESLGKTSEKASVDYLQSKKAIRMRELLKGIGGDLMRLKSGEIAKPLFCLTNISSKD
ncbi:ATP-dependent endonuclease [Marinobacterium aestuariivivens]|uniref:ATP-dependent endonuclease n=1 Tax=Marinobacterium aestuariivivens TaxID=1698799 RepID=A0ABW1ZY68_9GAMM